jgi:Na+-translocating ferredoxin:NAD+ oxidoreductase RnfG subunit
MSYRPVLISAMFLFLFAVVGTGLVAFTHTGTAGRIAENHRRALLASLNELVPTGEYNNDIYTDIVYVHNSDLLGTDKPVPVYRARKDGWPVAAVLAPVAPDGYNGEIRLLVAIRLDGTLAGVRVLQHRETPGLGLDTGFHRQVPARPGPGRLESTPRRRRIRPVHRRHHYPTRGRESGEKRVAILPAQRPWPV